METAVVSNFFFVPPTKKNYRMRVERSIKIISKVSLNINIVNGPLKLNKSCCCFSQLQIDNIAPGLAKNPYKKKFSPSHTVFTLVNKDYL